MRRPSKFPSESPAFEEEQAIVASRPSGFHRQMADRVLAMDDVVVQLIGFWKRAKNTDREFIKSEYPNYEQELEILNSTQKRVADLDPTMTATDIFKILELVRADVQLN